MTTKNLHLMGIDPGGTTGWCRLTIPRDCIFSNKPSEIVEWDYGVFQGPEPEQVMAIARLTRETQGLDYKTGPALVIEDWDIEPMNRTTDPESLSPVRIGAMLVLLRHMSNIAIIPSNNSISVNWLGDATISFQGRTIAKTTATDERLKAWKLYVANDHIRDATRHAITALRRARQNPELAEQYWP